MCTRIGIVKATVKDRVSAQLRRELLLVSAISERETHPYIFADLRSSGGHEC